MDIVEFSKLKNGAPLKYLSPFGIEFYGTLKIEEYKSVTVDLFYPLFTTDGKARWLIEDVARYTPISEEEFMIRKLEH